MPVQTLTQLPTENVVSDAGAQKLTQDVLEFAYLHDPEINAAQTLTQAPLEIGSDNEGAQMLPQYLLEFAYIPAVGARIGFSLSVDRLNG